MTSSLETCKVLFKVLRPSVIVAGVFSELTNAKGFVGEEARTDAVQLPANGLRMLTIRLFPETMLSTPLEEVELMISPLGALKSSESPGESDAKPKMASWFPWLISIFC